MKLGKGIESQIRGTGVSVQGAKLLPGASPCHIRRALPGALTALLLIQLLTNALWEAAGGSSGVWSLPAHVGDLDRVPESWL